MFTVTSSGLSVEEEDVFAVHGLPRAHLKNGKLSSDHAEEESERWNYG